MTLLLAILIIVGLHMAWGWYIVAVLAWLCHWTYTSMDYTLIKEVKRHLLVVERKVDNAKCHASICRAQK